MEDVFGTTKAKRTNGKKKGRTLAPVGESREDKLVRLGQIRMTQAKSVMRRLCVLGRDYPHTEAQRTKIIDELKRLVSDVEAAFEPKPLRSDEFTF